jgi:U3 small nucleolar RNA-associated protein 12
VKEFSFVIGSDSEELIFVNISDYGRDPVTKLPVFVKERGRFVREFFAKVDQIEFDSSNGILILLADRKHLEVLKFKKQLEVVKKFKRRTKRAKENEKELEVSKEEFLRDLKNWVEPVSKFKLAAKTDQIMLVEKKLVKKILDFDDEAGDETLENSNSFEAISSAVFFFYADNSYALNQYQLVEKDCNFKEAKNFGKMSHQNVIRSLALSSDDSMTLSCSVDSVKLWSNDSQFSIIKNIKAEGVMSSKFLPGDRYVVFGTKNGSLILVDI